MQDKIKTKLISVRKDAEQVYSTSQDIKEICKKAMDELTCYEHIIPDFFSYNNEAPRIKALYKKLKELDYSRNKVIPCVKASCAGYLYNEYFQGMTKFIEAFLDEVSGNGVNLSTMEKQLQTAMQGDKLFIESLFGGKNNEVCDEELTSAMQQVEYLVDFFETVKCIKRSVSSITDRAASCGDMSVVIDVVRLITNSTGEFCYRMITNIMNTYTAINDCVDGKSEKPVDQSFKVF